MRFGSCITGNDRGGCPAAWPPDERRGFASPSRHPKEISRRNRSGDFDAIYFINELGKAEPFRSPAAEPQEPASGHEVDTTHQVSETWITPKWVKDRFDFQKP